MIVIYVIITAAVVVQGLSKAEDGSSTNAEIFEMESIHHHLNRVAVPHSLLIKHVNENREYNDILSTLYSGCEFYISEQDPDNREYVKIDKKKNMITSIAIDREDEAFANMLVPQIQVKLQLECQDPNAIPRTLSDREMIRSLPTNLGDKSYVLTNNIDFSPLTMMLSLIIEDVNDKRPEFIYPPNSNLIIGYPDAAVSEDIFPDYLIKVIAIDKDAGINAKIKFKLWPSDDFFIDSESGEIYPFSRAMYNTDELSLKIYATDRNGADDGKVSSVDIKVKKVRANHLVLITVVKEQFEKIDKTLEILRHRTGINLEMFKKNFIPSPLKPDLKFVTISSTNQQDRMVILKCWVYAFDFRGELIDSNLIESKVSQVGDRINATAISYEKIKYKSRDEHKNENNESKTIITFIIIIVLLLIMLIIVIASFLCWYCMRLKKYKRMSTPSSRDTIISSISNEMDHHRFSIHDNSCPYHSHIYQKRDSLMKYHENGFRNSTTHNRSSILKGRSSLPESTDELSKFAQKLHFALDDISEAQGYSPNLERQRNIPDKRKSSVTFNDEVQFFGDDVDGIFPEKVNISRL